MACQSLPNAPSEALAKSPYLAVDHGKTIDLTVQALSKLHDFFAKMPDAKGKAFRIGVFEGGCSGNQYQFLFDDKKEGDVLTECGDISVVLDATALAMVKGSTVDYVDDLNGSGFVVHNPKAKASCGCGLSFAV